MHLIKLDATDSTNAQLQRLLSSNILEDYTVVTARQQEQGRGQMGTTWQSEAGKNLTFSVLRSNLNLPVSTGFVMNLCVSLSILSILKRYKVPELSIKWPNDILSGTAKLCGILIENRLSGNTIHTSIIGIGLNVNQTIFENLSNVSSLKLLMGMDFDLDALMIDIVERMKTLFLELEKTGPDNLWDAYEMQLFRRGRPSTFENSDGKRFLGSIGGVSKDGKLVVVQEDGAKEEFAMKEIRLLY